MGIFGMVAKTENSLEILDETCPSLSFRGVLAHHPCVDRHKDHASKLMQEAKRSPVSYDLTD